MPQLDTSTWLVTIIAMILTLFILIQLKFHKYSYPLSPAPKTFKSTSFPTPWETKWTKIYSPLLLPQQ
ncbi:ATP synthase F0 subunit 8 (mitochondrion) [Lepus europaeus]|uniref:ATP synthase complex subunit 8 n=1 Tax=Lepus europaeus TaxID=9983 RepID=Q8LWX2_LEPEU|nr:ATP synthase F0 subunit 8 [Lepus europaeus]ANO46436.1 ATP synthase F0 subunit 8 [Lepus europaeus]ANO46437.1 ATP synthase F0 subunit 8 [Lepus europaeus]ANO46438.1 ATP synthase F0 subunit 8 [Lepus europaeus]ANO46439.1 ATP synthase F0 subunit 8 [Lepus europaeus]ANO46440.1 ATP synthase F0 subunit 8 [Lepus europaeus]